MSGAGQRRVREDAMSTFFVDTPRAAAAFERIDDLMERGWEESYCLSLLLIGPARCGKTHIYKEWVRRREAGAAAEGKPFKAVVAEVPTGCNLPSMATALLAALGDPYPKEGAQTDRTGRMREAAGDIDLIVIDEIQRLIDENTGKMKKDVASWLAGLLNRRICPMLLVGEQPAETLFEAKYASGRTLGAAWILPYDWLDEEERREFRAFLMNIDGLLGMPEPAGLGATDLALRLHSFSGGRIGEATRLVDKARALARRRGRPKLTYDIFADAADQLHLGAPRMRENPFRTDTPRPGGATPPEMDAAALKPIRLPGKQGLLG